MDLSETRQSTGNSLDSSATRQSTLGNLVNLVNSLDSLEIPRWFLCLDRRYEQENNDKRFW
jgi:hypothetical protein